MKHLRNVFLVALASVLIGANSLLAQVMKQVPASAFVVLKVSDLEATSKKVSHYATQLGINQMAPDMADPLGSMLKEMGITEGINRSGDLAFAFIDPSASHAPEEKSMLLLLPVSDFNKFMGNFADAKPDGDLMTAHFKGQEQELTYFARWGDYVAASPSRDIVAKPPTDVLTVDGLAAKELDGKDAVLLANMKGLRPKLSEGINTARTKAPEEVDQLLNMVIKNQNKDYTKFAPLAKLGANQILDIAQEFVNGANAASLSINLSPDGIATTMMCQFDADSSFGQHVATVKNTDDSLLEGLAAGKYLLFGGASAQQMAGLWDKYLPPIQKAVTDLGPDYASINDWLTAVHKGSLATTGGSFGLMMPTAQPGAGALVQVVGVRRGDAKVMLDSMRQGFDAQMTTMKMLGFQTAAQVTTYTKDSKIVDGVSFDEMKSQFNMGHSPQEAQVMQFINLIYGPQGQDIFTGAVNDNTLLMVMGLDDASISAAITAAKSGADPLAKTSPVKTVAAELPAQRTMVTYVPLDLWATTGFGYAKMFGIDMGVVLPDNLPPLGATLSTDGTAVRGDAYMPSQLLQALTAASMQVYMKTQNVGKPPAGNAGGPPAGGM